MFRFEHQLGCKLSCHGIRVHQTKRTRDLGISSEDLADRTRENAIETSETAAHPES